jgi:hypothetical protein
MSCLCPFGCNEERTGYKTVPHILKDHKQDLLAAILPSGTLYSCLKSRGEGEPELCICFGCKVSWKNRNIAAKHFADEEGKKCLVKHQAFLQVLKED